MSILFFPHCSLASFVVRSLLTAHFSTIWFFTFMPSLILIISCLYFFCFPFLSPVLLLLADFLEDFLPASVSVGVGSSGLPVCFPYPHSVDQWLAQEGVQHNFRHFIALPNHPVRLSVSHNHHCWPTTASAWYKRWTRWGGRGASEFRAVSADMDISFARLVEEVSYQRRLATLLTMCCSDEVVPTAPEVAFFRFIQEWSPLRLVIKRRFLANTCWLFGKAWKLSRLCRPIGVAFMWCLHPGGTITNVAIFC